MRLLPDNLQAFFTVARMGTVHAAARALHLTQTGVTRRIATLEKDLDASLFLRSRRGMSLTEAGRALLAYCQQVIDLEGETLSRLSGEHAEGAARLVIQGPSSILRARVIPQLHQVLKRYPHLTVEFRLSDYGSGVGDLKRGEAHLVVLPVTDVVNEFATKSLRPERYILVGPTAWGKRDLKDIVINERIVDFDPSDQMTLLWLATHGMRGVSRAHRHFVNNTDALASMIEGGIGYSVLAQDFAEPLLKAGRLTALGGKKHFDFKIALAWYPRRHMTSYFKDILKAIT